MKFFFYLWVVLLAAIPTASAKVVVTSKPIYLIVEPLLKGIEKPGLLLNKGHCAHHHHLKPSDVKLLRKADVVFWSGAESEPLNVSVLRKRPTVVLFEVEPNFAWLSISAILKNLPIIARALKKVYEADPDKLIKFAKIDQNLINFEIELKQIKRSVKKSLSSVKSKRFVTTYDFFQPFSQEYKLNLVSYLLPSPHSSFSPKNLNYLYRAIENKKIDFVLKDHHLPAEALRSIVKDHNVKIVSVDVEGVDIDIEIDTYAILIERIVQSIVKCFL